MLASTLLHGCAILVLAALHRADLPTAPQERGVEIVWQDVSADAAPGEEAAAPPAVAAEGPPEVSPTEPDEEPVEPPPSPQRQALQPEAVEQRPPETSPPEAALAEVQAPEAELPPPIEPDPPIAPPPPRIAEAPPPPEPEEAGAQPAPEEQRPSDLPLPPPPTPAPPRPAAPRQPPPSQAAAAARQGPTDPAASPAATGGSRAVGSVSPPGLLDGARNPEPEYPLVNRQRGDQGVVTVLLSISEAGDVMGVEVVATSGYPTLDEAARRAVQRWRFRPAMRDGVPVAGNVRTAIHFRLR